MQEESLNTVTPEELALINKHTRRALKADEVYTFNVTLCDNEIDRDLERFDKDALPRLAALFVGKTGIFDHNPTAQNQKARIYAAECRTDESRSTQTGEPYTFVQARAYIPRTAANAALIEEIESGIKKEVSVGCAMAKVVCSICGAELRSGTCTHKRGRNYKGQIAHALLQEPVDAYEWSFVAVPAQVEAGVTKSAAELVRKQCTIAGDATPVVKALGDLELEELLALREEVRKETQALARASLPGLDDDSATALCAALSVKQCRAVQAALREKAALGIPKAPQLAPVMHSQDATNAAFRI
ncbi:MAG: hypothetical protein LBN05_08015 [Oscillospiraceae bacterium]|jgi:hypothetical protein|nr:hypothetical protein [Oscillospiraceae bacterium]